MDFTTCVLFWGAWLKNSPWSVRAETIRMRIFPLGRKDHLLSFTLDLVVLDLFVFLYYIHQLVHILAGFIERVPYEHCLVGFLLSFYGFAPFLS